MPSLVKSKPKTPIYNSKFEVRFHNPRGFDLDHLDLNVMSYKLDSNKKLVNFNFSVFEESLYETILSFKEVKSITINIYNDMGNILLQYKLWVKYLGPIHTQSYSSQELFEFNAGFKINKFESFLVNYGKSI